MQLNKLVNSRFKKIVTFVLPSDNFPWPKLSIHRFNCQLTLPKPVTLVKTCFLMVFYWCKKNKTFNQNFEYFFKKRRKKNLIKQWKNTLAFPLNNKQHLDNGKKIKFGALFLHHGTLPPGKLVVGYIYIIYTRSMAIK